MRRGVLTICAALALASAAEAADVVTPMSYPAAYCAKVGCRTGGFDIAIATGAGRHITVPITRSPYVAMDKFVMILPGETIAIQFMPRGGKLAKPKFLARYAPEYPAQIVRGGKLLPNPDDAKLPKLRMDALPPNTLVVSYGQINAQTPGMILKTQHNFARPLKFLAVRSLIHMGYFDPYETPTCAVLPGKARTEIWPDLMGSMMLANIRFIDLPKNPNGSPKVICEK